MRKGLIAANWKMNGRSDENIALLAALKQGVSAGSEADVLICPPSVYLAQVREMLEDSPFMLGAQNVYTAESGAFTGEISAPMLQDCGCSHVIIGHSERRELFGEKDSFIAEKFSAAQKSNLVPVLCIGETRSHREAGQTEEVVLGQLEAVLDVVGIDAFADAVIAYEPVWAIGTGLTATPDQAQEVHGQIRERLNARNAEVAERICLLYGGSVKGANAAELFAKPDIDGALVGGASLVAEEFLTICASYSQS